jgi:hypothetical protein
LLAIAASVESRTRLPPTLSGPGPGPGPRQYQACLQAAFDAVGEMQRAAVGICNRPCNGQPEAASSRLPVARCLQPEIRLEDLLQLRPGMGSGMGHGMMQNRMSGHEPDVGGKTMARPMRMMGMQHDDASASDMGLVHQLLGGYKEIRRTVSNLPDGIRTVTESDNPQVAQAIKAHVASMENRLNDGRQFSMFSPTLPTLFQQKDKIRTIVEMTEKGAVVTQSSSDPALVATIQAHAVEVSELAQGGVVAMMRSARANMPMMRHAARADADSGSASAPGPRMR